MIDENEAKVEEKIEEQDETIVNETDGQETACFRKCRGHFCLTPEKNCFQHEISLDFSPFLVSLNNYSSSIYNHIEALLNTAHSIERVKHLIRMKYFTCLDLCLFYLKRVYSMNNYYKIIIELNSHLLDEAKALDEQIRCGDIEQYSLLGSVAAIKGNISVRGMYNDAGAHVLHEHKMSDDAPVVKKLRQQGCLILGRTNLSEWAYAITESCPSGFSAVGGQCLHPDDIHEDVSGSSSGSAAGIKMNLFTFSLGTETQGSLLSPAMNVRKVCSLKPTRTSWPNEGIIPVNYDQDCCGPLTRTVADLVHLHQLITNKTDIETKIGRSIRIGYFGDSQDGVSLLQALAPHLPLTTLVDLNTDENLVKLVSAVINPTDACQVEFLDTLCYGLARDVPQYLSSHSSIYSHTTLASIIKWNSDHPQFIPYGQSLFLRAVESPISSENYEKYRVTLNSAFKAFVDHLQGTCMLDCFLTIKDDMLASTTMCGVPRASLTLDYYNPKHQQVNVVAVGLSPGDDLLILHALQRLEKANLQAGKIDIRTGFQKYVQQPFGQIYQRRCDIL